MTALMYIGGLGSGMDYDRGRLAQFFGVRARELLIPGEEVLPLRGYLQAFGRQMSLRGTALLFLFIFYLLHTQCFERGNQCRILMASLIYVFERFAMDTVLRELVEGVG